MSDSQAWYQRKLQALRQQPRSNPGNGAPPQPPAYPSQNGSYTSGAPVQVQYVQQPQQYAQPVQERVTTENLYQQAGNWRGGPAAKTNPDPCPKCGGNQYFANLQVSKRGPQPAGHCYNCGFNDGMFEQGLASSWGAG